MVGRWSTRSLWGWGRYVPSEGCRDGLHESARRVVPACRGHVSHMHIDSVAIFEGPPPRVRRPRSSSTSRRRRRLPRADGQDIPAGCAPADDLRVTEPRVNGACNRPNRESSRSYLPHSMDTACRRLGDHRTSEPRVRRRRLAGTGRRTDRRLLARLSRRCPRRYGAATCARTERVAAASAPGQQDQRDSGAHDALDHRVSSARCRPPRGGGPAQPGRRTTPRSGSAPRGPPGRCHLGGARFRRAEPRRRWGGPSRPRW